MNKPLLISLAAATLICSQLSADTMYDRFQTMELEIDNLKAELRTLQQEQSKIQETTSTSSEDEEEDEEDEDEEEEKTQLSSSDDKDTEDLTEDSDEDSDEEEIDINEALEEIEETLGDLNRATSGNHLKLGVDYRFAIDNLQYKMVDGSKESNDAFMTSRFWLNMDWAATENLSFTGQMAYNKAFGARSGANMMNGPYETFDWVANENAYNDTIRIRSAYFLYRNNTFFGTQVPWTFSIGRRPSTNGHLINLRDDDKAASPMGHSINVEFDGLSSKFSFDDWVDGMYVKFCAGRGMSNAAPKFNTAPYAENDTVNPDIDLIGLIFTAYDNGQYGIFTQYYYANNLIDATDPTNPMAGFDTVGGMHSFTASFRANGIGNEINDYLDDSTFFLSTAMNKTDPDSDKRMLYSAMDADGPTKAGESKTGYSIWAGLQMPSFMTDDGRWGLEYNYGSQYWRSITYAEDTNIGSKLAARGSAYEAYFTEYLVEDILSLQVRYTYIDYEYSGSNGFFGGTTGASMSMDDVKAFGMGSQVVDTAQDIRFYLRYKY